MGLYLTTVIYKDQTALYDLKRKSCELLPYTYNLLFIYFTQEVLIVFRRGGGGIIYPFLNSNGEAVQVWKCIGNKVKLC